MRVKISKPVAADYTSRGVFDFIEDAGVYELEPAQVEELKNDAAYYCGKYGPDMVPARLKVAYRALLDGLK